MGRHVYATGQEWMDLCHIGKVLGNHLANIEVTEGLVLIYDSNYSILEDKISLLGIKKVIIHQINQTAFENRREDKKVVERFPLRPAASTPMICKRTNSESHRSDLRQNRIRSGSSDNDND
ncbi:hypothetical protein PanWU01x14_278340 [Parasponia andersonii]|uniref:Uncharacterized protein n=1 Tax=Parasponia andersonii TaxID=3476 RepID=A0A2P5B2A0_PARAD|nr:hypothetical protein PanWU01x14_278340 [Parasponia andersonii]